MTRNAVFLQSLKFVQPLHSAPQNTLLNFLGEVHNAASNDPQIDPRLLQRYGVKEQQISRRSFECADVFLPPEERKIYRVTPDTKEGASITDRGYFYANRASEIFDEFYSQSALAPDHLIHVTCTGYLSPSAAQILVAKRNWPTEITHAYHMGCYASLPAIRLAQGQSLAFNKSVDIVHTELCSLHMNPADHRPEQIVVQSLFADGHASYNISTQKKSPAFKLLAIHERVLPDSEVDMEWMPAPWGMKMTLSRHVPEKIQKSIRTFTQELLAKSGISLEEALRSGIFAVHPGGPKIIDSVMASLELSEEQVAASRQILRERGNMSSATLPHVWGKIAENSPARGTKIISFAFGPGLTVFGGVFEWEP